MKLDMVQPVGRRNPIRDMLLDSHLWMVRCVCIRHVYRPVGDQTMHRETLESGWHVLLLVLNLCGGLEVSICDKLHLLAPIVRSALGI